MYHLNQSITDAEEPWMPMNDWNECAGDPIFQRDLRTYAVVRIGHNHQTAAVAIAQRQGECVALRVRIFESAGAAAVVDYVQAGDVEDHLRSLHRRYPAPVVATYRSTPGAREHTRGMPGPEFAYHGSFFEGSAQRLRQERLVMVDIPSTAERLAPAAETLMGLVTSRMLVHDGDQALASQIHNVLARPLPKGWAIDAAIDPRTNQPRRIVAAQAAMLAVHRAMTAPRPPSHTIRFGAPRR